MEELKGYDANIDVYDPWADPEEAKKEFGFDLTQTLVKGFHDAIIVAVAHEQFKEMGVETIRDLGKSNVVIFDIKYILPEASVDEYL